MQCNAVFFFRTLLLLLHKIENQSSAVQNESLGAMWAGSGRLHIDTREVCLSSHTHMEIPWIRIMFYGGVSTETSRLYSDISRSHMNGERQVHFTRIYALPIRAWMWVYWEYKKKLPFRTCSQLFFSSSYTSYSHSYTMYSNIFFLDKNNANLWLFSRKKNIPTRSKRHLKKFNYIRIRFTCSSHSFFHRAMYRACDLLEWIMEINVYWD